MRLGRAIAVFVLAFALPSLLSAASFGGVKAGAEVVPGWTVKSVTPEGGELKVEIAGSDGRSITFRITGDNESEGRKSPFESGALGVSYGAKGKLTVEELTAIGDSLGKMVAASGSTPEKQKKAFAQAVAGGPPRLEAKVREGTVPVTAEAAAALLRSLEGNWKITVTGPKAGNAIATGTVSRKALGNSMIQEDAEGTMTAMASAAEPAAIVARSFYGYIAKSGDFWYASANSAAAGFWSGVGSWDAEKKTLTFRPPCTRPGETSSRVVLRFTGPKAHVLEFSEGGAATQTIAFEPAAQ